jgi:hypothetical protein
MQNVEIDIVKKLLKKGHLGKLLAPYKGEPQPKKKKWIEIDLNEFFHGFLHSLNPVKLDDIVTVCVFGSVLYKHIPKPTVEDSVMRKKYIFFGEMVVKDVVRELPRNAPNDVDIMVISNTAPSLADCNNSLNAAFFRRQKLDSYYGGSGYKEIGGVPVHIHYRSVRQFLSGINNNETVCRYVAQYGIPFVGHNKFEEILNDIKNNKRYIRHKLKWKMYSKQECGVQCSSKWFAWLMSKPSIETSKEGILARVPVEEKLTRADLIDFDT